MSFVGVPMSDDEVPVTIAIVQHIYRGDGYVYISGPTGTTTMPAAADVKIDWEAWVPFEAKT